VELAFKKCYQISNGNRGKVN